VNIKTVLKTSVAAAALVAVAAPVVSTSAEAGISNGNKNSLVVNGQIVRQILFADDGNNSGMFLTDGTSTSSRVRWIAKGQATEAVEIGGIIELNIPQSNAGGTQSLGQANTAAVVNNVGGTAGVTATSNGANVESEGTDGSWGIRLIDISFKHKSMGKLSIGQGNTASNGKSETSLAGVGSILAASTGGALGGGLSFWDNTNNVYTAKKSGSSFASHDGLSRDDRIRYDLPTFAGVSLATSLAKGGNWDIGAGYSGKFGGIQVAAGAQYNNTSATSTTKEGTHSASLAVKHDSGLNAEVTWGEERNESGVAATTAESEHLAFGLGYIGNFVNLGSTAMQVTYTKTEEAAAQGDEAIAWNVAVAQNLSAVGSQLYLQYERVSLEDNVSTDYDDISMFMAGAKVTF